MSIDQATDNATRVAEIFAAFGRGDLGFILDRVTDDVRFVSHLDPRVPWAGQFHGKDQVAGYFQAMGSAVEVIDHPVVSLTAQDDRVIARGEVSFRVRQTDRPGSSSWVYVFCLDQGKITSFEQFNDQGLAHAFI
jgi:ketosteroid isomerase-like protein